MQHASPATTQWQKLGRKVRRGEKGISILAPMTYIEGDDDDNETGEVRTFFRAVGVQGPFGEH